MRHRQDRHAPRYIPIRDLGHGGGANNLGMSLVQCTQTQTVLLRKKVAHPNGQYEAHFLDRLKRLPNIMRLHDYNPHPRAGIDELYFEYCEYGTLAQVRRRHVTQHTRIPESFIWRVLLSVGKALEGCHTGLGARGWTPILHTDVHLGNILLGAPSSRNNRDPRIVLADFGRARLVSSRRELYDDIAMLGFMIYEFCQIRSSITEVLQEVMAGRALWAYSSKLLEVLDMLRSYQDPRRPVEPRWQADPRRPILPKMDIVELLAWIERRRDRARMREHGNVILLR
ncbi:unnamed protein product [Periconia digitata]|uniref:non-specific serine/threonine protein kinase n=1 Tax=Periconia digitata TaxID=1303443 RepID=A0A9W4U9U2_9PLEO|nr:unnamed protein product [Periconia digitata]